MSSSYYVLFYDYVEDVAERRGPYRDGHLRLLTGLHDSGYVVLGGARGRVPWMAPPSCSRETDRRWPRSSPRPTPTSPTGWSLAGAYGNGTSS